MLIYSKGDNVSRFAVDWLYGKDLAVRKMLLLALHTRAEQN